MNLSNLKPLNERTRFDIETLLKASFQANPSIPVWAGTEIQLVVISIAGAKIASGELCMRHSQ
jgi:hypothetical protein